MITILEISIPCPLRQNFDYIANDQEIKWQKGMRVAVPFGSRDVIGIIVAVKQISTDTDHSKLKMITEGIDTEVLITKEIFDLTQWISRYYHHPLGDCFQTVLPKRLRKGDTAELKTEPHWFLTSGLKSEKPLNAKQAAIVSLLNQAESGIGQKALYNDLGNCRSSLLSLEKKGLLEQRSSVLLPLKTITPIYFELNQQQQNVVETVSSELTDFTSYLLHGITGSGKTEVYIELAKRVLANKKQVLILIPEIGLTTQFVERFKQRLSAHIVVLNSSISDGERKQAWLLAKQGYADIVIGTRSSVFTPLPNLGLIIIDEEHDGSYKQQDGLRYHARNVALVRAHRNAIPIVLGSATPSLESLYQVKTNKYQLLNLDKRATGAKLPKVKVVDSRGPYADTALSSDLFFAIKEQIGLGNQVILFINRRGFAPVLMCHQCSWQATCTYCDAKMIVHQGRNSIACHHCGAIQRLPTECPECQHKELNTYGAGTEQIELSLQRLFPETSVLRIDRDSTQRVNAFSDLIDDINKGEARILVGTQMLAKGHDFHNVTLVGVLDADQGLFSADFRATESLAQLIVQVTGRAGRGDKAGEVIIQTTQPEHEFWQTLIKQGYSVTAEKILQERIASSMPPQGCLCVIRAETKGQALPMQFLQEMLEIFNQVKQNDVYVLGPVPCIMEKKAGRYRAQLLLTTQNRKQLHQLLDHCIPDISKLKLARKVRWSIDVDPINLL